MLDPLSSGFCPPFPFGTRPARLLALPPARTSDHDALGVGTSDRVRASGPAMRGLRCGASSHALLCSSGLCFRRIRRHMQPEQQQMFRMASPWYTFLPHSRPCGTTEANVQRGGRGEGGSYQPAPPDCNGFQRFCSQCARRLLGNAGFHRVSLRSWGRGAGGAVTAQCSGCRGSACGRA